MNQWPKIPLGEVLIERQEKPVFEDLLSGKTPIIEKIAFNNGEIVLRKDGRTKTNMILIRPGDLVLSGINAAKGAIAVYDNKNTSPIAATIHYGSYIPIEEKVNVNYLWFLLRSDIFRIELDQQLPGGIKTELKANRFLPIEVHLPSIEEQRRILTRIKAFAVKIEEVKRLRLEARNLLISFQDSIFNNIFEKLAKQYLPLPINKTNLRFNLESRNPQNSIPDKEFIYIDISSVENGSGNIVSPKILLGCDAPSRARRVVRTNNVILSTVRPNLKSFALIPKEYDNQICSTGFAVFSCPPEIIPEFLLIQFFSPFFIRQTEQFVRGGHYPALNDKAINNLELIIPRLDIQHQVIEKINEIKLKVNDLSNSIAESKKELDALLPSILDKAFKGEL